MGVRTRHLPLASIAGVPYTPGSHMIPIYLDNNASTPLLPAAWEAMRPYFLDHPGNPASSHHAGRHARQALENARETIAHHLDAHPEEVLFTSGATEANNLALFGLAGDPPGHIHSSPFEHPSITEPLHQLCNRGFTTQSSPPYEGGAGGGSSPFPTNSRLVTVQLANHETGAIQPIAEIAEKLDSRILFHCDAAAAAGKIAVCFRRLGVTSLTISGHKFHGPQGIGALLVKKGTKLRPLLFGGHQQQGKHPGTESAPLAVGMAVALEWAVGNLENQLLKVLQLRHTFLNQLRTKASPVVLNGPEEGGVPHTVNLSFPGCRADVLLMNLDLAGIACSTGSACSSGSLLPSPVLLAMGVPAEVLQSAMRFSLSSFLSENEVAEAANRISFTVNRLRTEKPDA